MSDYELHYWQLPFRGQFIRAILAFAGKRWDEFDDGAVGKIMDDDVRKQPIPFKGPPMLVDKRSGFALAQMPAIAYWLGETLDLLPATPILRALTIKIVNDANDVIDEITQDGGKKMWTDKRWKEFAPRLKKWMSLFEELGARHGLKAESGFLLGGDQPGIADVVTATLWSTMGERFPKLAAMLKKTAPRIAGLTARISGLPVLARLAAKAKKDYGEAYCGGQIEQSLRKVLKA